MNLSKRNPPAEAEVLVVESPALGSEAEAAPKTGKNAPTPRRNAARAARKQQLKAKPLSTREKRAKTRTAYDDTRAAMRSTDVTKLPANERRPELVYARDLVDTRANLGSAIIPVAVVYFIGTFVFSKVPVVSEAILFLALFWFIAMIVDAAVMSRKLEAKVLTRYPDSTVKVRMYAARRAFGLKRMRRPVPRPVPPANNWRA